MKRLLLILALAMSALHFTSCQSIAPVERLQVVVNDQGEVDPHGNREALLCRRRFLGVKVSEWIEPMPNAMERVSEIIRPPLVVLNWGSLLVAVGAIVCAVALHFPAKICKVCAVAGGTSYVITLGLLWLLEVLEIPWVMWVLVLGSGLGAWALIERYNGKGLDISLWDGWKKYRNREKDKGK